MSAVKLYGAYLPHDAPPEAIANISERPDGEFVTHLDYLRLGARLAAAERLLYECRVTLGHAAVFVRTREKMHPVGVGLYDALLTRLTGELTPALWCDTCEGEHEPGTRRGCRAQQEPPR